MSITDAQILLGTLTAIVIPFAVLWLPKLSLPSYAKWLIAVGISLVGGYLTVVIAGQLRPDLSVIQVASLILTASQVVYYGAFKGLGFEQFLYPTAALVEAGKQETARQLETVSSVVAADALNTLSPSSLQVTATVENSV
jgi:hypothetical protein